MFAGALGKHRNSSSPGRARRVLLGLALVVGFTLQAAPSAYASPPSARTSTVNTREGMPVYVFLRAVDPETDPLTYAVVGAPSHGSIDTCDPGYCLYTPTPGFVGVDSFTWTASDASSTSNVATATVTVTQNVAPIALSRNQPIRQNTPGFFYLDWVDVDYTSVSFEILTQPTHGTLTGCESSYCEYAPDAGYVGSDSFTWRVSDDLATSGVATQSLSVFDNLVPAASDSTASVRESKQEQIVLDYAGQPGESLTFSAVSNPQHGTLSCDGFYGYCYYEGFPGYTGPDSFTWRVNDGLLDSRVATVDLTVRANAVPAALDRTVAAPAEVFFYLSSTDADADQLAFAVVSGPTHGTLDCASIFYDNSYCQYTPQTGYSGQDSFTWQSSDDLASSRVATTTLRVGTDGTPVADNYTTSTYRGQSLGLGFPFSDSDGGTHTVTILTQPTHGTLTGCSVPENGCTYTPGAAYSGPDSVTWRVSDGTSTSNPATISIDVLPNAVPVASDTAVEIRERTPAPLTLPGYDPEGASSVFTVLAAPSHGSLTSCATGACTYTPTGSYTGLDSFTWRLTAGGDTSRTATMTIHVNPNNPPRAFGQYTEVNEDTATPLGLAWTDDFYYDTATFTVVTQPTHGTLTDCAAGAGGCVYTPAADYRGPDSFTWKVSDGLAESGLATYSLFVVPVSVPVAINTTTTVRQDRASAVPLSWSSLSGSPASITVVTAPTHGTVGCDVSSSYCTYTPTTGYTGSDSFTWKLNDGFADSNTATVSITVRANAAPVAVAETATTASNTAVTVLLRASDADGDTMTYAVQSGPTHGALSACTLVTSGWAQCTYTPTAAFVGTDSVSFRASDDLASSAVATTTITVTGQPPVVNAGTDKTGTEGAPVSLTGTASDPDGQGLNYQWSATAGPGVDAGAGCSFSASTSLTTTVTCTDNGAFTATLTASDGGSSTSDSATLTIANANPSVSITAPLAGAQVDSGVPVQVTAPITDPATNDTFGCNIAWGDTTTTAGTIVAGTCSGSHTYATAGDKTITVSVNDDDAGTASASVTVTQKAQVNLPPTADAGADRAGVEGAAVQVTGSGSDPEGATLAYAWSYAVGVGVDAGTTCSFTSPSSASTTVSCTDDGTVTLTLAVSDGVNPAVTDTATVTLTNANPDVVLTSPNVGASYQLGAPVTAHATFGDPGSHDSQVCSIDWGDGTTTPGSVVGGTCDGSHSYAATGTPTITVTVTDDDGRSGTASRGTTITPQPNLAPTADAGADRAGTEGSSLALVGSGSDPEGLTPTFAWSFVAGAGVDPGTTCSFGSASSASSTFSCTDDGTFTVTLGVSDGVNTTTDSAVVSLVNADPTAAITTPGVGAGAPIGTSVPLHAVLGDAGSHDTHTCSVAWGDGVTTTGTVTAGACDSSHTYAAAGARTITVTVTDDDGGTGTATRDLVVTDAAPTADAGADRTGSEGALVSLTGSGSDPEGAALSYAWTYAAGAGVDAGAQCGFSAPSAATSQFSCDDDGTFVVTLSVGDGVNTTTDTATVVLANRNPTAEVIAPADGAVFTTGQGVPLVGAGADPGSHDVLSCSIGWGDGSTGAGVMSAGQCTGTHPYATSGARTITLTVTDDDGGSAVATVGVTVTDQPNLPPTADAGADRSGTEGSPVTLIGSGSDAELAPLTYGWTYAAGAGVDSGATCSFGTPAAATTTFTCTDDGVYTATLSVSDGANPPTTDTAAVAVGNADPTVHVTAPAAGTAYTVGENASVSATVSDAGANDTLSCSIAWGDSTTTAGTLAAGTCTGQHGYAATGARTITVTVTDDDAGTGSDSVAITVSAVVSHPPTADAGPDGSGTEGSAVGLTGSGAQPDGHPVTYHWSWAADTGVDTGAACTFGSASSAATTVRCTDDGTYTVTLTVDDAVSTPATDTATVRLSNAAPTTSITTPAAGSEFAIGATVSVSAAVSDAGANDTHTCSLTWGDGSTGDGALAAGVCSASHTYSAAGARTVTVTATDDDGDSGSDTVGIVVAAAPLNQPPTASAGDDLSFAEGSAAHLSGSGSDPEGAPLTYHWSSTAVSGTDPGAACTFAAAASAATEVTCTDDGTFAVTLTVDDGTNPPVSDTAALVVTNAAPTVHVTSPAPGAEFGTGASVSVAATTADPGSNDTRSCSIGWGDGATTTGTLATGVCTGSHAYATDGARTITVTATDDDSGAGSDTVAVVVSTTSVNLPPKARAGDDRTGSEGSKITLAGSGKDPEGAPLSYRWTYAAGAGVDAGATCALGSPTAARTTFSCTDDGTYTVTLAVDDGTNRPVTDSALVVLANVAPTVRVTAPDSDSRLRAGQPVQASARIADRGGNDVLTCSIGWGDGTTTAGSVSGDRCTGSHTYSTAAERTLTVRATDDDGGTGRDSVCVTIRPVKVNRAPVVDAGSDVTAAAGTVVRLHAEVSDADGDALTYSWTLKADSAVRCSFRAATTGHATRVLCAAAGTAWATLTVSDGVNPPVSDTVQLTIRPVVCPDEQPAPSPGTTTPVAAASTVVAGRRSRRTA
jgi:hypothetical protein